MREIKFRAWDGKKWRYDFAIYEGDVYAVLENCPDTNDVMLSEERTSHWKVVQFTGLKDCNDVPMFEDDIVLMSNPTYQIQCAIIKGVVVFNYYSFGIQTKSVELWKHYNVKPPEIDSINYLLHCSDKIIEVIGNVHENPELLKAD